MPNDTVSDIEAQRAALARIEAYILAQPVARQAAMREAASDAGA
jgi:hypothetical protein